MLVINSRNKTPPGSQKFMLRPVTDWQPSKVEQVEYHRHGKMAYAMLSTCHRSVQLLNRPRIDLLNWEKINGLQTWQNMSDDRKEVKRRMRKIELDLESEEEQEEEDD
ncbi:hypothetical protein RUM43_013960 [Polyplax serrata]|uniref:Uncharacterized protein n=1 Tax=Polyplax serrata TaxID=468196 RepID=A0AAN8RS68_POLSC